MGCGAVSKADTEGSPPNVGPTITVNVQQLSGKDNIFIVPADTSIMQLKDQVALSFGLNKSDIALAVGSKYLRDDDGAIVDHIKSSGDPASSDIVLSLVVTRDPYEEFVAAKRRDSARDRSHSITRNGDWAIVTEVNHSKEDEENTHSDLYFLPRWREGSVKSTHAHEPTTAMPHGELMSFSGDDALTIQCVRSNAIDRLVLSDLM
mmetsp:Transcript_10256/g.20589  ORF Transcript_10256/g.20589 Transcript_10256/m.20589 type:complete len:206 (-) Transcript_10256:286-903(-)